MNIFKKNRFSNNHFRLPPQATFNKALKKPGSQHSHVLILYSRCNTLHWGRGGGGNHTSNKGLSSCRFLFTPTQARSSSPPTPVSRLHFSQCLFLATSLCFYLALWYPQSQSHLPGKRKLHVKFIWNHYEMKNHINTV